MSLGCSPLSRGGEGCTCAVARSYDSCGHVLLLGEVLIVLVRAASICGCPNAPPNHQNILRSQDSSGENRAVRVASIPR